ncbi:MAG: hypothetical protein WC956_02960 [bacterium]
MGGVMFSEGLLNAQGLASQALAGCGQECAVDMADAGARDESAEALSAVSYVTPQERPIFIYNGGDPHRSARSLGGAAMLLVAPAAAKTENPAGKELSVGGVVAMGAIIIIGLVAFFRSIMNSIRPEEYARLLGETGSKEKPVEDVQGVSQEK